MAVWLLGVMLAGCGTETGAPRYAVAARPSFEAASSEVVLTRSWSFGQSHQASAGWTSASPSSAGKDTVTWSDTSEILLTGPFDVPVDPQIHHWLSLQIRARNVDTLEVSWRDADETFDRSRTTSPMAIATDGGLHTYNLKLSDLRGAHPGTSHARDGIEAFMLRFRGTGRIQVTLARIHLVSDFDRPEDGPFALDRSGISRPGIALALPGSVQADLHVQAGDRLRLGLAVVADEPVDVTLSDTHGRIQLTVRCLPDVPWTEVDLDLSPLDPSGVASWVAGEPTPLRITAQNAPSGAVLFVGGALHLRQARDPRPNVIVYVEDTLRADRLSVYGHARATDPHLAAMAAQGAVFEQVFSTSSWTRPSMSSLLTSLDPVAHGNQTRFRRVPASLKTLPEALADAGWFCAGFVTNFHAADWAGLDQGFDIYHGPRADGAYQLGSTLTSAVIAAPLDDLLERYRDVQTFVLAHSFDPHEPYEPPAEDVAALAGRRLVVEGLLDYEAEILHNDHQLAHLDATLERLGLFDDTLLMFTSDHGEAFGEHGQTTHRRSLHQEEVSIPWIVRWPGEIPAGMRIGGVASTVDIAPTLLGLLDVASPPRWVGTDRAPALRGGGPLGADRPLLMDVVYMPEDRPTHPHEVGVILEGYKLIATVDEAGRAHPRALYELAADPGEEHNLVASADHARIVAALAEHAQTMLDGGPLGQASESTAEGMDPEMQQWMLEMGYLQR